MHFSFRYTFIINRPKGTAINYLGFTRILTCEALAALGATFVLATAVYACHLSGDVLGAFGTVSLAYLQRGSSPRCHTQSNSLKMLCLSVRLSGFAFFACFSALLTSWLTSSPPSSGIRSFKVGLGRTTDTSSLNFVRCSERFASTGHS